VDATVAPWSEMVTITRPDLDVARDVVNRVVDPEIPVLTIAELGILRDLAVEDGVVVVTITPTYSGCPALGRIEEDIRSSLAAAGFDRVKVTATNSPPWSTDWIGPEARAKLVAFGIAPPTPIDDVLCPRCVTNAPRMVSRFGSTACKALLACSRCGEPFDWFKEF
jgi:ring-1,2-phenylacetyl-CoA epoxidase subunit PaaD